MADLIPIDQELTRLTQALRIAVGGFEQAVKDAADKRSTYDIEYAKAFLSIAEGTQKARESEAVLIVQAFMRDARIAEATMQAFKERVRAIQTVISIQQSRIKHIEETASSGF